MHQSAVVGQEGHRRGHLPYAERVVLVALGRGCWQILEVLLEGHDGLGDDVDGQLVALLHLERVLEHQDVRMSRGLEPLGAVPRHLHADPLLVDVVAHKLEHARGSAVLLAGGPVVRPAARGARVGLAEVVVEPRAGRAKEVTDGTEVHAEVAEHRHGSSWARCGARPQMVFGDRREWWRSFGFRKGSGDETYERTLSVHFITPRAAVDPTCDPT